MTFWIMFGLTVLAMIAAGVLATRTQSYRRWRDGEDIAMAVFFTWLVSFVISWIVIGIAAGSLAGGSKAEWVTTGSWEHRVAEGTVAGYDPEDGEFEYYVNEGGVLREIELYGPINRAPGGDGRTITYVDQRQELGTSVFPWGQSNTSRTVTIK